MLNRKIVFTILLSLFTLTSCGKKHNNTMEVTAETAIKQITENVKETESVKESAESTETVTEATEETEESEEQNEHQENDFAENVCIVGDSIALGYGAYQRVPSNHVFAKLNVAPSSVRDYTFDYGDGEYNALAILNTEQPDNIMLSMGVNDITTYSGEVFAEKYLDYIRDVRSYCPNAKIYIMGLTPVMSTCGYTDNKSINGYNEALKKAVEAENSDHITFVDVPQELYDANGFLKSDYSSGDGMHLTGAAYDVQLENILSYLN